ncbi:MAG: hypothetical protein E4H40_03495 [Candidatus Brocadiia bacterium]|nr:MAG: hypothetical protein E4H40_03495 [Candidatus Brocadiia bacterium]
MFLLESQPKEIELLPLAENAGMPPIYIRTVLGEPFAIKEITSTCGCIKADFDGNNLNPEFVIQSRVDVSMLKEGQGGEIKIRTDYDRWPYMVLYYKVLGKFHTEPETVLFSDARDGVPVTVEATVINNYGKDFEIESIRSVKGYTEVLKKEKVPKGWRLELKITPPPIKNSLSFSDIINVNVKDSETVIVYCLGHYARAKEILEELNRKDRPKR